MSLCSPVSERAGSLQSADLVPQMAEKLFEPCSKPHLHYIFPSNNSILSVCVCEHVCVSSYVILHVCRQ